MPNSEIPKPRAVPAKAVPTSVQVAIRLTPESRETIRLLAERENLTVQQLGHYAWSLALQAYGLPPLPEIAA